MKNSLHQILHSFRKKETKKWGAAVESMEFEDAIGRVKDHTAEFKHPETGEPFFVAARGDYAGPKFETWFEVASDLRFFEEGQTTTMVQDIPEMRLRYPWLTDEDVGAIGRLRNGGFSEGHVVYITDAMRDSTMYEGFKLFQHSSEGQVQVADLAARQALARAIKKEGLGAATLSRLLGGEDIRVVFEAYGEIPKSVFDAYNAWKPEGENTAWLKGQQRMFQGPKGATEIGKDGRAMLHFFKNADPLTVVHEVGHIFRLDLQPSELDVITNWLQKTVRNWEGKDLTKVDVIKPLILSAKFECPSCGNLIKMVQYDEIFRTPKRCGCGRKGNFRNL